MAAVAIFALSAAGCGADDPAESVGGVGLCDLDAAAGTPVSGDSSPVDSDAHNDEIPDDAHNDDAMGDEESNEDGDSDDLGAVREVDWLVDIEMDEFSYGCVLPTLEVGTVVAMRFTNVGVVEHEAVIGDLDAQNDAEAAMSGAAMDSEDHGHEVPSITLGAGESGVLEVVLDSAGPMIIGCHIPGHWDSGMRSDFTVI